MPIVSVLIPTFQHASYIRRALESLLAQDLSDWECVIVDDGSTDETSDRVAPYLSDVRFRYERLDCNRGLGGALNEALSIASSPFIAYLPADDVYYADHLSSLAACLNAHPEAALAFSGIRHHYNRYATGQIDGYPLQLVQVMHRAAPERWLERFEYVTDNLEAMFWSRLIPHGAAIGAGKVTCEWVDHPLQRHKVIQEPIGGINPYRQRYGVAHPLRFHTSVGNRTDEVEHYRTFRERPDTPAARDGLKIVLVGELAYNPERILALEERGHKLYGLWMRDPHWYNTVGPLPFGHVEDIPRNDWRSELRRLKPDIIYALLNWQAVPWAHEVLSGSDGIPFVWHFKEGPFICLDRGTFPKLIELYTRSDGQIYSSPEMRDWFGTVAPECLERESSLILDGDLPKREWFAGKPSPRLSDTDGEIHTVVPGRPIGLHPQTVVELAAAGVHVHFYGDFTHGQWKAWIEKTLSLAPRHLHLHSNVDQEDWVAEFSKYDAGWLHYFRSENRGDVRQANWDDLNYPARISTLVAAGLPLLQCDNSDAVVATDALARQLDIGLFFRNMAELGGKLREPERMARLRRNVWECRERFTFDYHAGRLIAFFREVIRARSLAL